ncbi:GNAT family N-acetyltransferase [Lederbergia lenta]|uniref:GCN5-like N-acetyltransferase n=1 Tax=Lederbergia lenta TaxID=1467 RepID=A0A2X4VSK6_LEDLE|nr:GNAT family N-acetyltransferase [Lederbergia lenta]MEC2325791.1 GNAT family N-acetyltransferase [Lederbergia lenta]SQI53741.1 GCN5-like N-acetyltransferase [Lederbergia lenta]
MKNVKLISHYLHNDVYRKSFNQLSIDVFNLDFEPWYEAGFFNNRYIPHSFLLDGKIIANVSVSFLDLIINHQPKKAVQIGTVMTDKRFRNKGLSKLLMEHVIAEYEDQYDFLYLFANDKVLQFYPKFGFKRIAEKHYALDAKEVVNQVAKASILNPNRPNDRKIISRLMENRKPVSNMLGVVNDKWPLSASTLDPYCDYLERYFFADGDVLVLADREHGVLNIYDIISQHAINLDDIVEKMVSNQDNRIEFHFIPELIKYKVTTTTAFWEDDTLFVRSKYPFNVEVLFPLTSHT